MKGIPQQRQSRGRRRRRITLLDIGLDEAFNTSMTFVQSVLQNINADFESPVAEIDFIRSRHPETVFTSFTAPCNVLHVMAHGDSSGTPTFSSTDERTVVSIEELARRAVDSGRGISSGAVISDGCRTGTGAWTRAILDCLQGDITYIGTTANVGWHESTTFSSAFYSSLFRDQGYGRSPAEQARDAAVRAIEAYIKLTDRSCPYKVMELTPHR
ncbi:hypothetical protein [Actinoplanes sp. G11-F43]|uniref:hypothetical protein n=1 Tax=Actinoplanes sp. G11-F43 TaxID=3424130 RepID=UPI003D34673F